MHNHPHPVFRAFGFGSLCWKMTRPPQTTADLAVFRLWLALQHCRQVTVSAHREPIPTQSGSQSPLVGTDLQIVDPLGVGGSWLSLTIKAEAEGEHFAYRESLPSEFIFEWASDSEREQIRAKTREEVNRRIKKAASELREQDPELQVVECAFEPYGLTLM